jgi:1,4-dihydroxy-2-naphthoate octaprenyltransferase
MALIISGAVLGLLVAAMTGPLILLIGTAGGLTAIFYSAPPCLVCRGLGDLSIALSFGVLPLVGTVYVQTGEMPALAWWAGAAIGCFVAAILWANSIPDIKADRKAGKLSLPVRLGERYAWVGLPLLFALGFLLLAAAPLPAACYLALMAAGSALIATRAMLQGRMMPALPLTIGTHAVVCILLTLGLMIG